MAKTARTTISCGFGSLMDIDKLIHTKGYPIQPHRFGSLMDIDKLILISCAHNIAISFGSLMDIDKLIHKEITPFQDPVLVL